jgi:DNA excision repair protein ERCC-2
LKVIKELKEFHISIKDVILATKKVKLSNSVIPFSIRASKGTEFHKLIQKEREKTENSYQREVLVKFQIKIQGWNFIISGRADIIYERKGILIIEEIKSVTNLDDFDLESETAKEYCLQLLLYGHYFLNLGKKIQCHLVLVDIFTEEVKIIDVPHQDMIEYLIKQCETILNEWEMAQRIKAEQRERGKTVKFPFENYRINQEEIIKIAMKCIQKRKRLMLSAPSGLGKTVGTLFPALKYALKKNLYVFVVTSKTTQQHIYRDTLRIFAKKKAQFNSIILTAKEKLCINSTFTCEKSLCPYLDNYTKVSMDKIVSEMLTKQVIDGRYIRKIAKTHTVCPFELSLDCSLHCDVIVGDYNYVFHPYIRLKRYFEKSYDNIILIIDEAHNLPFRAMTYYSPEITLQSISNVNSYLQSLHMPKIIEEKGIDVYQQITDYISDLIKPFPNSTTKNPFLTKFDKKFFQAALKDLEHFILLYIEAYTSRQGFQPGKKDAVLEFVLNFRQFTSILKESNSPEFSELLYIKDEKIKILCKSAAPKLQKQIAGFHSVIMQSATLFPLEYFQKMSGFPSSAQKIQYLSPFAQQNRLYLLMPYLSTKYEDRRESYDLIASIISNAVNVKKGNYLAFFPSFAYLKAVQNEIETIPLSVNLIVQERKMSEAKRRNYLKKLKNSDEKHLLLAVHGGIFSEGVDFIGDMAIGAFIIGPGLPAYSKEQELMREYYDLKWKKGFEYAYRNPGIMKVIQAAGRIFRTSADRGFVMLIGHRFRTNYYNSVLPSDWKIEQPPDLVKRIQTFWATLNSDTSESKPIFKTADLLDFARKD